ncbi:hypothetical protein Vi05172_g13415 [Venturia inaequalis]|nr:hypothetical protein Vi05172_g13415 [Venturia inaequalis]
MLRREAGIYYCRQYYIAGSFRKLRLGVILEELHFRQTTFSLDGWSKLFKILNVGGTNLEAKLIKLKSLNIEGGYENYEAQFHQKDLQGSARERVCGNKMLNSLEPLEAKIHRTDRAAWRAENCLDHQILALLPEGGARMYRVGYRCLFGGRHEGLGYVHRSC